MTEGLPRGGLLLLTVSRDRAYTLLMDISLIARGGVPIRLDRPRVLFFDMVATWALMQRYKRDYLSKLYRVETVTPAEGKTPARLAFELMDIEVLAVYLMLGLQADAKAGGESVTLEQVQSFLLPTTVNEIFELVIAALGRGIQAPAVPGKPDAATASPAAAAPQHPGPTKASTTRKPSASRSRSSTKPRSGSGRKR